ncbi:MAG: glycosyltransferase, partial [Candidatus Omnitrophica bacterium]|nr:glycosyltransferase [Candidatus Omnitrophota bacterium]
MQRTVLGLLQLDGIEFVNNIIVVDNGSDDETYRIVHDIMQGQPPGKIHYASEQKKGKPFALNTGMRLSTAPIVVFTDDDVDFDSSWLQVIMDRFQSANVQCLTGKIVPRVEFELPKWYSQDLSTVLGSVDLADHPIPTECVTGANMALRREALQLAGEFQMDADMVNEDTVFSHKIRNAGCEIYYEPSMIVYHRFQEEKFNKAYFRHWYFRSGKTIAGLNKMKDRRFKCVRGVPLWRYRQGFIC